MKLNTIFEKPEPVETSARIEKDANGEINPACVGRRHWWVLIRPSVYRCKFCEAAGKNVIKYQPGGWGGYR